MITLTEELLRDGATSGKTRKGAEYYSWTRKQLQLIAWDGDYSKGWIDRTVGQQVHENLYRQFIELNPKCQAHKGILDSGRRYLQPVKRRLKAKPKAMNLVPEQELPF
jgi:hypothetical protein